MAQRSKHDGVIYKRSNSKMWWMRYRDKTGRRRLESTGTEDWGEAQKLMRERLAQRDNNTLEAVRKGKQTTFDEWADFFWRTTPSRRFGPQAHTGLIRQR